MTRASKTLSKVRKPQIRYKYTPAQKGVQLGKVKCPVCGNGINWVKPVKYWTYGDGKPLQMLLAECWNGDSNTPDEEREDHLFMIEITGLPIVEISRTA